VSTEKQESVHAINISQEFVDKTAKDRHEWFGLTHIEIGNLWADSQEVYAFAKAIDAKLKEKNT
jgi:hypothetical protein